MPSLVTFLLVFVSVGAVFLAVNMLAGKLIRPERPGAAKTEVYECGEVPVGPAWVQFDMRFYVVALLFLVFDVEAAFLFPWAVVFGTAASAAEQSEAWRTVAWQAFADFAVFFGLLLVGFAYLWRRGDLDWVRGTAAHGRA